MPESKKEDSETEKKVPRARKIRPAELPGEELSVSVNPPKRRSNGQIEPIVLDDKQLNQIEIMAGFGMKMDDISLVLGFTEKTLYNLCNRDPRVLQSIKGGHAKAVSAISQTAYQLAKSGKYPAMTMFWLKCRQRWREVHPEDQKRTHEVVFKTQIGDRGQIHTEQIESSKGDRDNY